MKDYWRSNLTLAEYCRRRGVNARRASKWLARLRPDCAEQAEPLEIVQVSLADLPAEHLSPQPRRNSGVLLELGQIRVCLEPDFDAETLRRALAVLEAR